MSVGNLIKSLCKERKIAVYRLEKDLDFSNGYIRSLGETLPLDRATKIAEYLNIDVSELDIYAVPSNEPKIFDVEKELNDLIRKLNISDQLSFSGEILTDDLTTISKEQLLMSLKFIINQQQHLAEQDENKDL